MSADQSPHSPQASPSSRWCTAPDMGEQIPRQADGRSTWAYSIGLGAAAGPRELAIPHVGQKWSRKSTDGDFEMSMVAVGSYFVQMPKSVSFCSSLTAQNAQWTAAEFFHNPKEVAGSPRTTRKLNRMLSIALTYAFSQKSNVLISIQQALSEPQSQIKLIVI